jgi:dipeptidase E
MKLFLTSTGLENKDVLDRFKNIFLVRKIKNLSFLIVSIQNSERDAFYLKKTLLEIRSTGASDIDVFKLSDNKFVAEKDYDVVFVCGGNTFDYLDRIRKTGLDKFIIDFSRKKDSVYVGVSAGSIIAGPNIEISAWGDEGEKNNVNLKDLKGLALTNFSIYPHYREDLKSELEEFRKRVSYPVIELQDDQVVILNYSDIGNLKDVSSIEYINKEFTSPDELNH